MQLKTICLVGCLSLLPSSVFADDCLHLAMPGGDRIVDKTAAYATEMFYRFGVCTKISVVPPRRATKMMRAGKFDGEIARIADYADTVRDIAVKVPTPVLVHKACMVTSDPSVQTLKDIDKPTFTIGIVRGWIWMAKVAEQVPNANVRLVEEQATLIEMFEKGRLDAILMGTDVMKFHQMHTRFNTVHIDSYPTHIWLHKDKAHMLKPIDDAIIAYTQHMGENAVVEAMGELRAK